MRKKEAEEFIWLKFLLWTDLVSTQGGYNLRYKRMFYFENLRASATTFLVAMGCTKRALSIPHRRGMEKKIHRCPKASDFSLLLSSDNNSCV